MSAVMRPMLALIALAAGVLAAIAGSPAPPLAQDEISAIELAEWVHDRKAGLLVVDARSDHAIDDVRVPGARALAGVDVSSLENGTIVVVYAAADVDSEIVEAMRRGNRAQHFLRLRGGIAAWQAQVLFPVLRSDAPAAQQQHFVRQARLSRYFGGTPRLIDPGASARQLRGRRGC